jgi:hypothetical protein
MEHRFNKLLKDCIGDNNILSDIKESGDLSKLISYNYILKPLDEMDGPVKIAMTLAGKVAKHFV